MIQPEEIFEAYSDARKNKRRTRSQILFEMNLEKNLIDLYHQLNDKSYKVGRSMCFIINDPVKREVFAASFRDRIVHHYLYNKIAPVLDRKFIFDSYSCREGKGTLKAVERLEHHIRSCSKNYTKEAWVLKLDISGYFMSINRNILYDRLLSMLPSDLAQEHAELIKMIVFNDPIKGCRIKGKRSDWDGLPESKSMFYAKEGCGLPIGNLTSQLFSNVYLSALDDFVKRVLKVKHYGRYVDDFYLIHEDPQYLKHCKELIGVFLNKELCLQLHPNKAYLQQVTKGVKFMGMIVKPYRRYTSKRTINKLLNVFADINDFSARDMQSKINSYFGYLSHSASKKFIKRFITDHPWIKLCGNVSDKGLKLSYSSKHVSWYSSFSFCATY